MSGMMVEDLKHVGAAACNESLKAGKELVEDIRQFGIITGQHNNGFVVGQCLEAPTCCTGCCCKLILNVLFVFVLCIPKCLSRVSPMLHCRPVYQTNSHCSNN